MDGKGSLTENKKPENFQIPDYLRPLDILKKPKEETMDAAKLQKIIVEQQQQINSLQTRVILLEQAGKSQQDSAFPQSYKRSLNDSQMSGSPY